MLLTSCLVRGSLHRLQGITSFAAAGTQPFIPAIPENVQAYGTAWRDDYNWIQSQPREIERILREEAKHFRHVAINTSSIAAVSSQLRSEIHNLLPHQTVSIPEIIDGWEYVSEQSREHLLPVYYRRRQHSPSNHHPRQHQEKEILLDVNELGEIYGDDIVIGQIKISKCGNLMACTISINGVDDLYSVLVREVKSGCIYEQTALKGVVSIEWDGDNETLIATQPDELGRPAKVVSTSFSRSNNSKNGKEKHRKEAPPSMLLLPKAELLYEEKDPRFFLELQRTKDWKYLMINANSKTSSEVYILPTTSVSNENNSRHQTKRVLTCVQPRRPGLEYFLEHLDGKLYIISNSRNTKDLNYDLYSVDVKLSNGKHEEKEKDGAMNEKYWKKVKLDNNCSTNTTHGSTENNGVFIEDLDVNHNGIVLYQRSCTTGKPELEIIPIESLKHRNASGGGGGDDNTIKLVNSYRPQLPDYAWSITPGANADFNSDFLRILVSSPVHPDQALDWNLKINTTDLLDFSHNQWIKHDVDKELSVIGHNPDEYILEKTWAPMLSSCGTSFSSTTNNKSRDGPSNPTNAVPLSLIYSKLNTNSKGSFKHPRPCLVVVYASYGINLPTDFLLERLPLLKRGWTIALVHARGGGELGRQWHAAGRGPRNKPNSALDIESAVEYLIHKSYTMPGIVALEATSAGAVAAGGVLNHRPELFGGVVLESPFVDVLSTMIDPELPLTVHEYEEFGDPSTELGMQGLQRMCPYHNIIKQNDGDRKIRSHLYPPVLITCSSTDARVPIWGPLKYAAKLRAAATATGAESSDRIQGGKFKSGGGSRGSDGVKRGSVLVYADAHGGHLADHNREKYDVKAVQYAFLLEAIKQQQQQNE
jgi:protease II